MDVPPAVVALLVGGRRWLGPAITATVLDLAARGVAHIEAVDNPWPRVAASAHGRIDLDAFEVACLARLDGASRPTPWPEIATWAHRSSWAASLSTHVRAAATDLGLVERRRGRRPRATASGEGERAGWVEVATRLAALDPFRLEPPASVAYWGRSLAFAEALGLGPHSVGSPPAARTDASDPMQGVALRAALRLASFRSTPRVGGSGDTWWYVHAGGDRAVVHRESRSVERQLPSPLVEGGLRLIGLGDDARWASERSTLVVHQDDRVVVVAADLDHFTGEERLEVARALADAALAGR